MRFWLHHIASFPGSQRIGGSAWYTLFAHARSVLGNLHTICYTNHALTKQSILVHLLISHTAELCSLSDTFEGFQSQNVIALTTMACIISFRATSKGKITSFTCHSAYLEWTNGRIIFASEELRVFVTSLSSFRQNMVNGRHLSNRRNRLTKRG